MPSVGTIEQSLARTSTEGKHYFPWWLQVAVVLGASLMLMGAFIAFWNPAMLVSPHDEITAAVRTYAGYLVSRNGAVGVMLLAALFLRARGTLNTLLLLTAGIQIVDAVVDGIEGRWPLVPGVLIFAAVYLVASARLSGYPFWKLSAWTSQP